MAGESYRRGIALFDYRAVEPDELSFNRGDSIVIFGTPYDGPANHLRLDVTTLDFNAPHKHVKQSEPPMSLQPQVPMVQEESSASTMCVLSQDNDTKRIFERLYETGITHVKKKLEDQEVWKSREIEALKHNQFKACAKSTVLARKSRANSEMGNYAHCGEYLYHEGLKAKHFKAERARNILHEKRMEELSCQFKPEINEVSRKLRRDMPVVQKLTMYEQIKQEKLDSLRKSKEQEENKTLSFAPNILKYDLKKERQRIWTATDVDATIQWHQEKESRLQEMRNKLDLERGVTHKPSIDKNSKELANAQSKKDEDIFTKLHRDAEKISLKKQQARQIENRLWSLDLAGLNQSAAQQTPRTPRRSETPRANSHTRVSLHEDAELRRLRKLLLEKHVAASESKARNDSKIDPKSEQLSRERLRRDCKTVLEMLMFENSTMGTDQITYEQFFRAIDDLVDFTVISSDLTDLSREEKEVLIDRIWYAIGGEQAADRQLAKIALDQVLDATIKVHTGGALSIQDPENAELEKAAIGVFEEFVRRLTWKKLASYPAHLSRQKAENLEKRYQSLKGEAIREFATLLRKCGVNVNDVECKALFQFFELDGDHGLDYIRFEREVDTILSPRRRAIVRSIQALECSDPDGPIQLRDFLKSVKALNTSKTTPTKLEDILSTMSNVRRRLRESTKGLGALKASDSVLDDSQKGSSRSTFSSSSPESLSPSDAGNERLGQIAEVAALHKRKQAMSLDAGNQLPRHVQLYQLSRKWLENRFSARQVQDEKEMEHCTFRPQINPTQANKVRNEPIGERLYELAKSKDAQCEHEPSWEQRQFEECTFRPQMIKSRPTTAPVYTAELLASKRHVERVRSKHALEREGYSRSDSCSSNGFSSSPPTPKAKASKEDRQGHPLMIVEVNLPGGKVGRISVQRGDDPGLLARNFCVDHELNTSSEIKLSDMLKEQLSGLYWQVEAGSVSDTR